MMVNKAKKYEEDDKLKMELIEIRNRAESLLTSGYKTIEEFKPQVEIELIETAEGALSRLQNNMSEENPVKFRANIQELLDAIGKLHSRAYEKKWRKKEKGEKKEAEEKASQTSSR
jgi:molecular chaperone DnaK